ncbi:MAG: cytochrome c [Acetobacter papayae]|uniref:c-type cytochrome n=1 Tax=Acetobacter papayae TaxID=1076592 RepID=UPI0039ECD991
MMRRGVMAVAAVLLLAGCSPKSPKSLYGNNCGICHHGGDGMPGSVPPLVGRIDKIAATPEGRHYLADVLMHGVSGRIMANGQPYNAEMPPFRYLKDEDVASILTWLSARGGRENPPAISPSDIAAARGAAKSAGQVADERDALNRQHPIP